MDLKEMEKLSVKLLENFSGDYKNQLTILFFEAIKRVGLNKKKIIDFFSNKVTVDFLNELSASSIIKKQVLKNFIILSEDDREKIFINFIDFISDFDEKDGNIVVQVDEPVSYKTKVFSTKNKNIVVKLLEDFEEFDDDSLDFSARNDDFEIRIKCLSISVEHSNVIDQKADENLKKYISNFKLSNNLRVLKMEDTKTIETHAINSNNYIYTVLRKIDSVLFENDEKYFIISTINYVGKNSYSNKYLAFVIQSFDKVNYEKYKEIIDLNLGNLLYQPAEKEYLEIQVYNNIVDKIKLELSDDFAVVVEPKELVNDYNIVFQFGDDGYTLDEFRNKISSYVNVFNEVMNKIDMIYTSMYENAQSFLISWEEMDEENLDFVKKCSSVFEIAIYEENVDILCSVYDDEKDEELLGGHFVSMSISLDELKNEEFEWNLS